MIVPEDAVVVFDVDDTLYLERCYVRSGFVAVGRALAERHRVDGVADQLWQGFLDGVRGDAFDRVLRASGIEGGSALVAELVETYRSHRPDIELLPDAVDLLDALDGRPAAAITDGPAVSQRAKVTSLELHRWMDPVILTAELGPGHGKPDPLAYESVEATLGVAPGRCWYIADNPRKDFVTPLARGWTAVRIRRPLSLHREVPSPAGVHEIETRAELSCR